MRVLPGDYTRGRRELLEVLGRTEAVYVAARVRVTRAAVYHWTSGRTRPNRQARRLLAANYGIDPEAWEERAGPRS